MTQLAENHELPNLILSYRNLLKLKNTYTDKLGAQVSNISNRLHTSYNQTITITGRLSSSSPNLRIYLYELMMVKRLDQHFIPRKDINYSQQIILR